MLYDGCIGSPLLSHHVGEWKHVCGKGVDGLGRKSTYLVHYVYIYIYIYLCILLAVKDSKLDVLDKKTSFNPAERSGQSIILLLAEIPFGNDRQGSNRAPCHRIL